MRVLIFRFLHENKQVKYFLAILIISGLIYALLRITIFETDPLFPFLDSVFHTYLLLPEGISNLIFKQLEAGVMIADHRMFFEEREAYHLIYSQFTENLTKYMLYKRWSILIITLIWLNFSSFKRKALFSLAFLIVHVIAVVSGLYLLGITGPRFIDESTSFHLTPTLYGNLILFVFLSVWFLLNKEILRDSLSQIGLQINLSNRRIHEAIVMLFFFIVLGKFLIPFFAFKPYVIFILKITQEISSVFGFEGYIVGDQLRGENGALALAKHCLGFKTIYVYAALVIITRPSGRNRLFWIFLYAGLTLIFISNLVRLTLVFVVAQGPNGYARASLHHEVYNVAIYIIIFLMWVIWVEVLRRKGNSSGVKY